MLMAGGGSPTITSGCSQTVVEMSSNKQNIPVMEFDPDAAEYAVWTVPMPNDYDGGAVTAQVYWTANSTSTNSVVWKVQGTAFTDDSALDASWGTAQGVTDANGSSAYTLRVSSETSAITIAGSPAGGYLVQFRVYRDATDGNDNLAADALLIGVKIKYTTS